MRKTSVVAGVAAIALLIWILLGGLRSEMFDVQPYAQPLQIARSRIVDPIGWRWTNENTVMTTVQFTFDQGELDYDNLIGRPGLGFPSSSDGFGYSSWNKLQGTNAWFAWNEGTGGTGWFWWKPSGRWRRLPDEQKRKMLELDLMTTNQGVIPDFPVGYSITCPDLNFSRSLRIWVEFTSSPISNMSQAYDPYNDATEPGSTTIIGNKPPPLQLEYTNMTIHPRQWTVLSPSTAEVRIPVQAKQGGIDWAMITGAQKKNTPGGSSWLSWSVNMDNHAQSPSQVVLDVVASNAYEPPTFPATYVVDLKDANRDRSARLKLIISKNPFDSAALDDQTLQRNDPDNIHSSACPPTLDSTSCRCNLPLMIRRPCQEGLIRSSPRR